MSQSADTSSDNGQSDPDEPEIEEGLFEEERRIDGICGVY